MSNRATIGVVLVGAWMLALIWMATDARSSECTATATHPRQCVRTVIVGHRAEEGPASGTNENTLAALRHDHEWGADYETDQWNLADGTPVIFHDSTLNRVVDPATMPAGVTGASKPGDLTIDQWRMLRTKGGEPLPTLYQWLKHAGRWSVSGMVEVKYTPVHPERIAAWVQRFGPYVTFYALPNVYAGRCHQTAAVAMRDAGLGVGLKASRDCPMSLSDAAGFGYRYVIASASVLTPGYVREAHTLGLRVGDYLAGRSAWAGLVSAWVDYLLVPHVRSASLWFGRGRVA